MGAIALIGVLLACGIVACSAESAQTPPRRELGWGETAVLNELSVTVKQPAWWKHGQVRFHIEYTNNGSSAPPIYTQHYVGDSKQPSEPAAEALFVSRGIEPGTSPASTLIIEIPADTATFGIEFLVGELSERQSATWRGPIAPEPTD